MLVSMARLFTLAGTHKSKMIGSVVLAILSVAAGIIPYFIVQRMVMEFISGRPDMEYLSRLAMLIGVCLVLKVGLFAKATSLSHWAAYSILYNTRIKLANKFTKLSLGYLTDRTSGKIKKVMLDDVEKMEQFLAHNIPETISSIVIPLLVTIYLFMLDWRMALIMLLPVVLAFIPYGILMKDYKSKMEQYNTSTENVNAAIVEYIKGMAVIKAFNQTTASFAKYSDSVQEFKEFVLTWFQRSWHYMSAYAVLMPASLIVVLPAGAYFYLNGSLELSAYILFLLISLGFAAPVMKLVEFIDGIVLVTASETRIHEVLEEEELLEITAKNCPQNYSVQFDGVTFSYGQGDVIKGVSFVAEENTTTALVGPSGSGKSTLAKLIARFWDIQEGRITIGGLDLREIPVEELMKTVSFVFQDVFLFNVSIKENIKMGKPDATDEEVIEVAKLARCHEFIVNLKDGYDTLAGEGGCRLSGGEKQRISIARAILRNAPVVILDEATASMDPENEDKIQEALNNLAKGKTLIVIAHRLSTIMYSEKIIVIDQGKIQTQGTHEELLEGCPLYRNMWNDHIEAVDWDFNLKRVGTACSEY
ncbi:ABC transporter ATP-binding protein [Desulforamulus ruminis]